MVPDAGGDSGSIDLPAQQKVAGAMRPAAAAVPEPTADHHVQMTTPPGQTVAVNEKGEPRQ